MKTSKSYFNPYFAGIGLGFVILFSFILAGRGLGAAGALTSILTFFTNFFSSDYVLSNSFFSNYLFNDGENSLKTWLVFELIGLMIGGFLSGLYFGRLKIKIVKGDHNSNLKRLIQAFVGGTFMGFAVHFARGCTSGQALSGTVLLSLGSWIFMLSLFGGGYLFAWFVRGAWK